MNNKLLIIFVFINNCKAAFKKFTTVTASDAVILYSTSVIVFCPTCEVIYTDAQYNLLYITSYLGYSNSSDYTEISVYTTETTIVTSVDIYTPFEQLTTTFYTFESAITYPTTFSTTVETLNDSYVQTIYYVKTPLAANQEQTLNYAFIEISEYTYYKETNYALISAEGEVILIYYVTAASTPIDLKSDTTINPTTAYWSSLTTVDTNSLTTKTGEDGMATLFHNMFDN